MKDKSESLQKRHNEWINIVNRGDAEVYAGMLTEGTVCFPSTGKLLASRKAFKE